ncbi:hypothetical protein ACPA9J_09475 [Pseudomonas aeruginosa]
MPHLAELETLDTGLPIHQDEERTDPARPRTTSSSSPKSARG